MIKKKFKEYFLTGYIIANLLFVMFGSYLFNKRENLTMHKFSRMLISLLIVNVILIIIHIVKNKINKKKIRFRLNDLFLIYILIFSLISAILSIHTESAFFGFRGRYEGFFQILYYFSLYMLSTFLDDKKKKYIAIGITSIGTIEVIYAIMQKSQLIHVFTQYHHEKPWATGFATNPNFFGSLTILSLSFAIGLFMDEENNKLKIVYGLLITLLMSGLLISDTLSALVGLIIVMLYLFIYSIIKKKKIMFTIVAAIIAATTLSLHLTNNTSLVKDLIRTKDQSIDIAKGHMKDNYGSNRMYIWKNTMREVPKNLLYGVGIDNFYYAFGDKPLTMKGWFFDKAHNEYLQILICEGIFALISYLLFFGIITLRGIKYNFIKNKVYLILPIIAYLVQAFFNISVIEIAPYFYCALGLCVNRYTDDDKLINN